MTGSEFSSVRLDEQVGDLLDASRVCRLMSK
jgi:hypothetical protein